MSVWRELEDKFSPETWVDYSRRALPDPLDNEITRLLDAYRSASNSEREQLRRVARLAQRLPLLAYAERMATLGLRERAPKCLEDGLLAIAVDDFGFDARDAIPILALQYNAAQRIGIDPDALFELASQYASDNVAEVLRGFPRRNERDKSLAAMGYRESGSAAAILAYERESR